MDGDETARFAELVTSSPDALRAALDEVVLLIAAHEHHVDVDEYRRQLDAIAGRCARHDASALVHHVFVVEDFRGNVEEYYDPRNSYLDAVIDRRLGIPITLAVVAIEVGRRLEVSVEGVGMPGHFLIRTIDGLVDPFTPSQLLTVEDCAQRFHAVHGADAVFDPTMIQTVGAHAIVGRILANLRQVHLARRDSVNLEWVLRLRALLPGATIEERAERAGVLAALGRFADAADVLEELAPDAASTDTSDRLLGKARQLRARLN